MEDLQGHWQGEESRSLLSQGDSDYSSQTWAPPPRRTLPRPPTLSTLPRVRSSQELGPALATRETARSLGRSISKASQEGGARGLGPNGPYMKARWRLPTAPREEVQADCQKF